MAATNGAIGLNEVAYELPYAVGLQLIWSRKVDVDGEITRAVDRGVGRGEDLDKLIG